MNRRRETIEEMMSQVETRPEVDEVQRLVILDWDDTCNPSSWAASKIKTDDEYDDAEDEVRLLAEIENGILGLLNAAEAVGCYLVIITNADEEWVRFSCSRYLRRIAAIIQRLPIISARHYEGLYPGRSVCWKAAAFTHVAKAFFTSHNSSHASGQIRREIISIGDSNDERLAARAAAAPLAATPKAIKLVDSPRLRTVAAQLDTVAKCLPFIAQARHAIDIDIAALLNYMAMQKIDAEDNNLPNSPSQIHLNKQDSNANSSTRRDQFLDNIWKEAAWGLLTAIRIQGLESAVTTSSLPPPPLPPPLPTIQTASSTLQNSALNVQTIHPTTTNLLVDTANKSSKNSSSNLSVNTTPRLVVESSLLSCANNGGVAAA